MLCCPSAACIYDPRDSCDKQTTKYVIQARQSQGYIGAVQGAGASNCLYHRMALPRTSPPKGSVIWSQGLGLRVQGSGPKLLCMLCLGHSGCRTRLHNSNVLIMMRLSRQQSSRRCNPSMHDEGHMPLRLIYLKDRMLHHTVANVHTGENVVSLRSITTSVTRNCPHQGAGAMSTIHSLASCTPSCWLPTSASSAPQNPADV